VLARLVCQLDRRGEFRPLDSGGDDFAYALAVQANGKLVAGGYGYIAALRDFAVARYTPSGTLDRTSGRDHGSE
jgi:hypothetical protein